ncbi:hypothetical protein CANTEDRAFT_115466 [Yamadazyma tenuis ATCC 10573]|uniref:Zn(2)-C6 fungal-type domain-containing protein n=2 Tax=Candida tenuis TaxID=2315449 RepID=G3BA36_CANTC|nr:uncharacterized protein CANTEDRAFT_115466 [Yamadazyma tenuis ATCC 10573]EGV62002.1 hypothetical protein CANTEDRAFT_115466 [Yamadazyma tenuis ATCC 10573]
MTDYRSYQQVVDLAIRHPGKQKKSKVAKKTAAVPVSGKTRTKTGCLTCRRRKKKCDENIVNGKCQGCSRNFLDCSWPVLSQLKVRDEKDHIIALNGRKLSVSSDCSDCSTVSASTVATMSSTSPQLHAYSSPKYHSYPSPRSPTMDEMPIKLPPLRLPEPKQQQNPTPQFVVTCVDNCHSSFRS